MRGTDVTGMEGGTVGERLRSRRLFLRLRLEDVALSTSSNCSTLSRIENGKRSPTVEELDRLAVALRCTARDLVPVPSRRSPRSKKHSS